MMCFVIKKLKTLVGRRGSDLEQAHREQKGKKDKQIFVGKQVQHSLNASSFQALLAQLTHVSSPYHFFTALSFPMAHTATSVSLFPSEHTSHLFPGKAGAACLPPSHAWPAAVLTKTITSASIPQTRFSTKESPSSGRELLSSASPPHQSK